MTVFVSERGLALDPVDDVAVDSDGDLQLAVGRLVVATLSQRILVQVRQPALLPNLLEQTGTQPPTERAVEHRQRPTVIPVPTRRPHAQRQMGLLGVAPDQLQRRTTADPAGE